MSALLVEALRGLQLRPGDVYRTRVDGRLVEVRVADEPTPSVAESVMLEPWVELPFEPIGSVIATPGIGLLPDPPDIPADEEIP